MNSFIYIALAALLGTAAVQGYGPEKHFEHDRPPHGSPEKSHHHDHSHGPRHGPHYGPPRGSHHGPHPGPHHGPPHGPHHGPPHGPPDERYLGPPNRPHHRPPHDDFGHMFKPDFGSHGPADGPFRSPPPWDDYSPEDSYGSDRWDRDEDSSSSGPDSWGYDDDSDYGPSDEDDMYNGWHHHFHTNRPPRRPTTKKPIHTRPPQPPFTKGTLPVPTTTGKPHLTPRPTPKPTVTTWATPSSALLSSQPTSTVGPIHTTTASTASISKAIGSTWRSNTPSEETTQWQITTSSPETITNTEKPTLSPEVQNCIKSCYSTPEYNPVCGTNRETYDNEGKLLCAQNCKVDVKLWRRSLCPPSPNDNGGGGGGGRLLTTIIPLTNPTSNPNVVRTTSMSRYQRCMQLCRITSSFSPVCGTNFITYMNIDRLKCAESCGEDVKVLCEKPCAACGFGPVTTPKPITTIAHVGRTPLDPDLQDCIKACPTTTEYNPVCGSDGATYTNPGRLVCAQLCGVGVSVVRMSPCSLTTPTPTTTTTGAPDVAGCIRRCPVTSEYNPVCGTDNRTYNNPSSLECAKFCGVVVELKLKTRCTDNLDLWTEGPNDTDTAPTLPSIDINGSKDTTATASRSTTSSTTRITTPSTTQATTPISTMKTTTDLVSTLGFSIPQDILDEIFRLSTTPLPATKTTSADYDETVDIDPRFGNKNTTKDRHEYGRILFPE